jgi:hypothetical protein
MSFGNVLERPALEKHWKATMAGIRPYFTQDNLDAHQTHDCQFPANVSAFQRGHMFQKIRHGQALVAKTWSLFSPY